MRSWAVKRDVQGYDDDNYNDADVEDVGKLSRYVM